MNERIQKLAEQANAQYCDLGDASCFKRLGLVEAVIFTPEDLERFAEMIVKECAKLNKKQYYELLGVIVDTEEHNGFDDICLDTIKRVAEYLESDTLIDHFGEKQ